MKTRKSRTLMVFIFAFLALCCEAQQNTQEAVYIFRNPTNNKFHYIDKDGNDLFQLLTGNDIAEGMIRFGEKGEYGKQGYTDSKGNTIIPPIYWNAKDFSNGMAEVGVNKTYGFLDNKGAVVIPLNLKHIGNNFPFVNGNAYAVKDNKLVIINLKGEVVKTTNIQSKTYYIEMTADGKYFSLAKETVYDDSNGIMVASSWMVVDLAGKIFFEVKTAYPPSPIATSTGYLIRHDGCHYMDKLMKKIFTISCEDCRPFSPGIVIYVNEQGVAFTDERGKSIKEAVYDNIGELVDGLAWAKKDGKYGFVDDKVNMVIEQKFDMAKNFSDGLALVKQGEKFGYIDKQGQFKIDPTFEVATSFRNGMAQVGTKTNQYLIDKSGKVFFKLKP